jgi:hypothetical protein
MSAMVVRGDWIRDVSFGIVFGSFEGGRATRQWAARVQEEVRYGCCGRVRMCARSAWWCALR